MAVAGVISFEITGDKELDAKFHSLERLVQRKILRQGLRPAVKLVHQAIRSLVTVRSGNARDSLKVKAGKRSRRTPNRISIVVLTAAGWFKGPSFYFPMADLGHKHGSRKLGKGRKKIAGKKWMKRGLKSVEVQARQLAMKGISEGIMREAANARTNAD